MFNQRHFPYVWLFALSGCTNPGGDAEDTGGEDDTSGEDTEDGGNPAGCVAACLATEGHFWECSGETPSEEEMKDAEDRCMADCQAGASTGGSCPAALTEMFECQAQAACDADVLDVCADVFAQFEAACHSGSLGVSTGTFSVVNVRRYPCGIETDGALVCWGLGSSISPTDSSYTTVAVGTFAACAIAADQNIRCWNGFENEVPGGSFVDLAVGYSVGCALGLDGSATCWGTTDLGETLDPPKGSYSDISVGTDHACALQSDGVPVCWGRMEGWGEIPSGPFVEISSGPFNACARASDGVVTCWGGKGSLLSPPTSSRFTQISVSHYDGCGVDPDGKIACWGTVDIAVPNGSFTEVSFEGEYACAVRDDGHVVCFGVEDGTGRTDPP